MPQEHQVLRCFSCEVFQVHIVKKDKKWQCKICGAKQSLKRNYGKGSGKDCRMQVMKLNELRVLKSDILGQVENESFEEALTDELKEQKPNEKKTLISKWTDFIDENEADTDKEVEFDQDINTDMHTGKAKKHKFKKNFDKTHPYDNAKSKYKKSILSTKIEENVCFNSLFDITEGTSSQQKVIETVDNKIVSEIKSSIVKESGVSCSSHIKNLKPNLGSNQMIAPNKSKYSKYMDDDNDDEELDKDNISGKIRKTNIFESDPADLDTLLDF